MSRRQEMGIVGIIVIAAILVCGFMFTQWREADAAAVRHENIIYTLATGSADSSLSVPGITAQDEVRSVIRFPGNATADSFDIAVALTTPRVVNPDSVRFVGNYTATSAAKWLVIWRDKTF